jgi:hypothetical protein
VLTLPTKVAGTSLSEGRVHESFNKWLQEYHLYAVTRRSKERKEIFEINEKVRQPKQQKRTHTVSKRAKGLTDEIANTKNGGSPAADASIDMKGHCSNNEHLRTGFHALFKNVPRKQIFVMSARSGSRASSPTHCTNHIALIINLCYCIPELLVQIEILIEATTQVVTLIMKLVEATEILSHWPHTGRFRFERLGRRKTGQPRDKVHQLAVNPEQRSPLITLHILNRFISLVVPHFWASGSVAA